MKKIGLSLLASALLAACASQQTAQQPAQQQAKPASQAAAAAPAAAVASNPLTDPNNILSKREVYFDFDKYNVKEQFSDLVKAHAGYLTATKGAQVSLQGHADARGTAEYNLALGQKRANAVKDAMVTAYGASAGQIETISYGKERPVAEGNDEAAWSKNRRVEIVYPGEAKFPKK